MNFGEKLSVSHRQSEPVNEFSVFFSRQILSLSKKKSYEQILQKFQVYLEIQIYD